MKLLSKKKGIGCHSPYFPGRLRTRGHLCQTILPGSVLRQDKGSRDSGLGSSIADSTVSAGIASSSDHDHRGKRIHLCHVRPLSQKVLRCHHRRFERRGNMPSACDWRRMCCISFQPGSPPNAAQPHCKRSAAPTSPPVGTPLLSSNRQAGRVGSPLAHCNTQTASGQASEPGAANVVPRQ